MILAKIWQGGQWRMITVMDGSNVAQSASGKLFRIDDDGNLETEVYRFRIYNADAEEYTGGNYKPQSEAK